MKKNLSFHLTSPSFLQVLGTLFLVALNHANRAIRANEAPKLAKQARVNGTPAAAYATVAALPAAVLGDTFPYPNEKKN